MKDVQNLTDCRGIAIQNVGVSDVHMPALIKTKDGSFQSVLANIKLTVSLPQEYKGTHMSRFIEVVNIWSQKPIAHKEIEVILSDIIDRLDARQANIEIWFKYFIKKTAPVSGLESYLDYDCHFSGRLTEGKQLEFLLGISVPFTSLCPCSKEISLYGAHNQRGVMKAEIKFKPGKFIWIEDLARIMEEQASSPIYPLLKREDEKFVTEAAYNNAKFVEDVIRDLVIAFRARKEVSWFNIECVNFESIHNHNAYAQHSENIKAQKEG